MKEILVSLLIVGILRGMERIGLPSPISRGGRIISLEAYKRRRGLPCL